MILPILAATFICAGVLIATPALADPCNAPLPRHGETFAGPVEYVGDGDGFCVRTSAGLVEVRVADFYAPELNDPGGREAKAVLERLVMGRTVRCVAGKRSYDRITARCTLNGASVGDLMRSRVKEGGRGYR